jgi:hypothetical protein
VISVALLTTFSTSIFVVLMKGYNYIPNEFKIMIFANLVAIVWVILFYAPKYLPRMWDHIGNITVWKFN